MPASACCCLCSCNDTNQAQTESQQGKRAEKARERRAPCEAANLGNDSEHHGLERRRVRARICNTKTYSGRRKQQPRCSFTGRTHAKQLARAYRANAAEWCTRGPGPLAGRSCACNNHRHNQRRQSSNCTSNWTEQRRSHSRVEKVAGAGAACQPRRLSILAALSRQTKSIQRRSTASATETRWTYVSNSTSIIVSPGLNFSHSRWISGSCTATQPQQLRPASRPHPKVRTSGSRSSSCVAGVTEPLGSCSLNHRSVCPTWQNQATSAHCERPRPTCLESACNAECCDAHAALSQRNLKRHT